MKTINLWISFFSSIKNKKNTSKIIGKWKMSTQEDDFFTERRPSETYEFKEDGQFIHVFYEKNDVRSYTENHTFGNWKHIEQLNFSCALENKKTLRLIVKESGNSLLITGTTIKFRRVL